MNTYTSYSKYKVVLKNNTIFHVLLTSTTLADLPDILDKYEGAFLYIKDYKKNCREYWIRKSEISSISFIDSFDDENKLSKDELSIKNCGITGD